VQGEAEGAVLDGAHPRLCDGSRAMLEGASLRGARLTSANFGDEYVVASVRDEAELGRAPP